MLNSGETVGERSIYSKQYEMTPSVFPIENIAILPLLLPRSTGAYA